MPDVKVKVTAVIYQRFEGGFRSSLMVDCDAIFDHCVDQQEGVAQKNTATIHHHDPAVCLTFLLLLLFHLFFLNPIVKLRQSTRHFTHQQSSHFKLQSAIMFSSGRSFLSALMAVAILIASASAFTSTSNMVPTRAAATRVFAPAPISAFGKKKQVEDLSSIESRDMTREEMLDLNAQNEEIMNMELTAMTGFSLVLSLPILYLCWVAFFSD